MDFNIYAGRSTLVTGKGLSFDAVMSLMNQNFLGSGYHIYCDSFYTSLALFANFVTWGLELVGHFLTQELASQKQKLMP